VKRLASNAVADRPAEASTGPDYVLPAILAHVFALFLAHV
jgi:hypothetical protein